MDKELIITDRKAAHLIEEISRVQRQIKLFQQGDKLSKNKNRLDIALDRCKEINRILCEL